MCRWKEKVMTRQRASGSFVRCVSFAVIIALLVTTTAGPVCAIAPRSVFQEDHQDGKRPPDLFETLHHQVSYIRLIQNEPKRTYELIRFNFALSGIFSPKVLAQLDALVQTEQGVGEDEAKANEIFLRKKPLFEFIFRFPQSLQGKNSWDEVDPAKYEQSRGEQSAGGLTVGALDRMGWRLVRVAGKIRIVLKEEAPAAQPIMAADTTQVIAAKSPEQASTSATTALADVSMLRRHAMGFQVRGLCANGRYNEAVKLIALGTQDANHARETCNILLRELEIGDTGKLLRHMNENTAAYLLATAVAIGEAPKWERDVRHPFTPVPKLDSDELVWACDVLRSVCLSSKDGSGRAIASRILQRMVARPDIRFGAEVADAILRRCLKPRTYEVEHPVTGKKSVQKYSDQDLYPFGIEAYLSFKKSWVLKELDVHAGAEVVGRQVEAMDTLYALPISKIPSRENPVNVGPIQLTTNEELVDYLVGLMKPVYADALRGDKRKKGVADETMPAVSEAHRQAAFILLAKLPPLRALQLLPFVDKQSLKGKLLFSKQVREASIKAFASLLPLVRPELAARFFVEVNQYARPEEKENVFIWTMECFGALQARALEAGASASREGANIVRAMISGALAEQGGSELFRKILDSQSSHPDYGVAMELHDALCAQPGMVDMVDWFTYNKTGKLFRSELTEEEKRLCLTDWTGDLLLFLAVRHRAHEIESHVERLCKLGDKRVIPALIAMANRNCQTSTPAEWRMTPEEFDRFNMDFLRKAHDMDPDAFAQAYWTHTGAVLQPWWRGFRAMLRDWNNTLLSQAPQWRGDEMDNLAMQCLAGEEQTDFILRGVRDGAYARVAGFIEAGLTYYPEKLDPRAVVAAAFMKSNRHLRDLLPLIRQKYPRLAGLYRSRSVLDNFDLRFEGTMQHRGKHPFQGEHVDVEIAIGSANYQDLLRRMATHLDPEVEIWDQVISDGNALQAIGRQNMVTLAVYITKPVDVMQADWWVIQLADEWQELLITTKPGTPARQGAIEKLFASLKMENPPEGFMPLFLEYAATRDLKEPRDLYAIANYVWSAMLQKPPEKVVAVKELVICHQELSKELSTPPILIPEEWKQHLRFRSEDDARTLRTGLNLDQTQREMSLIINYLLPLYTIAEPVQSSVFIVATLTSLYYLLTFWPGGELFSNALPYEISALISWWIGLGLWSAVGMSVIPLISVCSGLIMQLFLWPVAWSALLGKAGVHYLWHNVRTLPKLRGELRKTLQSMQTLLPQLEFDAEKTLEEQIPKPLLESYDFGAKLLIQQVDKAQDASELDAMLKEIGSADDPMTRTIRQYAKAKKMFLVKAIGQDVNSGDTIPISESKLGHVPEFPADILEPEDGGQTSEVRRSKKTKAYLDIATQEEMNPVIKKVFDDTGGYLVADVGASDATAYGRFGMGRLTPSPWPSPSRERGKEEPWVSPVRERGREDQGGKGLADLTRFVRAAKQIVLDDARYPFKQKLRDARIVAVAGLPNDGHYGSGGSGRGIASGYIPWNLLEELFERHNKGDPQAVLELADFIYHEVTEPLLSEQIQTEQIIPRDQAQRIAHRIVAHEQAGARLLLTAENAQALAFARRGLVPQLLLLHNSPLASSL